MLLSIVLSIRAHWRPLEAADALPVIVYFVVMGSVRYFTRPDTQDGRWVAFLFLEELLYPGIGLLLAPYADVWRRAAFAAGTVTVAVLLFRARLPEWALPLKGVWLRRMLAGLALLVFGQGAWLLWSYTFWDAPRWHLLLLAPTAVWLLRSPFELLVSGTPARAAHQTDR
ncbi:MAG TPA: hypothetical protein VK689_17175 [Armatimonadota bacterium]|nr:hypothetical protein [Armatimonadota bacterium]